MAPSHVSTPFVNVSTTSDLRTSLAESDALAAALAELLSGLPASPTVERAQCLAQLLEHRTAAQLRALDARVPASS